MFWLLALVASCDSPAPACVSLVPDDRSVAVVEVPVGGRPRRMLVDTAWPNLAFAFGRGDDLPADSRDPAHRSIWGTEVSMLPLQSVIYSWGGRSAKFKKPERIPQTVDYLSSMDVDGIFGIGAFGNLGSEVTFGPGGSLCVRGERCTTGSKIWLDVTVGGTAALGLVDSAAPYSRILDPSLTGPLVIPGQSGAVAVRPTSESLRRSGYGNATIDGRRVAATIGWDDLRNQRWTWRVCDGTITFDPDSAAP